MSKNMLKLSLSTLLVAWHIHVSAAQQYGAQQPQAPAQYSQTQQNSASPQQSYGAQQQPASYSQQNPAPQPSYQQQNPAPQPSYQQQNPAPQPSYQQQNPAPQPSYQQQNPAPQPSYQQQNPAPQPSYQQQNPAPQPSYQQQNAAPQPSYQQQNPAPQPSYQQQNPAPQPSYQQQNPAPQPSYQQQNPAPQGPAQSSYSAQNSAPVQAAYPAPAQSSYPQQQQNSATPQSSYSLQNSPQPAYPAASPRYGQQQNPAPQPAPAQSSYSQQSAPSTAYPAPAQASSSYSQQNAAPQTGYSQQNPASQPAGGSSYSQQNTAPQTAYSQQNSASQQPGGSSYPQQNAAPQAGYPSPSAQSGYNAQQNSAPQPATYQNPAPQPATYQNPAPVAAPAYQQPAAQNSYSQQNSAPSTNSYQNPSPAASYPSPAASSYGGFPQAPPQQSTGYGNAPVHTSNAQSYSAPQQASAVRYSQSSYPSPQASYPAPAASSSSYGGAALPAPAAAAFYSGNSNNYGSQPLPGQTYQVPGGVGSSYPSPQPDPYETAAPAISPISEGTCSLDPSCWETQPQTAIGSGVPFDRSTGLTCEECLALCTEHRQDSNDPWRCEAVTYDHRWQICDLYAVSGSTSPQHLVSYAGRDYFRPTCEGEVVTTQPTTPIIDITTVTTAGPVDVTTTAPITTPTTTQPQAADPLCQPGTVPKFQRWEGYMLAEVGVVVDATTELECVEQCKANAGGATCHGFNWDSFTCELFDQDVDPSREFLQQGFDDIGYFEKLCVDPPEGTCPQDVWDVVPNTILIGFVVDVVDANSVEECQRACARAETERGFPCASGMYYYGDPQQSCLLNSNSRVTNPENFVPEDRNEEMVYFDIPCGGRSNRLFSRRFKDLGLRAAATTKARVRPMAKAATSLTRLSGWTKWSNCSSSAKGIAYRYERCSERDIRKCKKEEKICNDPGSILRRRPLADVAVASSIPQGGPTFFDDPFKGIRGSPCVAVRDHRKKKRCPHGIKIVNGQKVSCENPIDC